MYLLWFCGPVLILSFQYSEQTISTEQSSISVPIFTSTVTRLTTSRGVSRTTAAMGTPGTTTTSSWLSIPRTTRYYSTTSSLYSHTGAAIGASSLSLTTSPPVATTPNHFIVPTVTPKRVLPTSTLNLLTSTENHIPTSPQVGKEITTSSSVHSTTEADNDTTTSSSTNATQDPNQATIFGKMLVESYVST